MNEDGLEISLELLDNLAKDAFRTEDFSDSQKYIIAKCLLAEFESEADLRNYIEQIETSKPYQFFQTEPSTSANILASELPIDKIKQLIKEKNRNNFEFSKWDEAYVEHDASISKKPQSPGLFVEERQEQKFKKAEIPDFISKASVDILGIQKIIESPDNDRLVIVGEPGVGKTTSLRHFAYRLSGEHSKGVPIYVKLGVQGVVSTICDLALPFIPKDLIGEDKREDVCKIILSDGGFILLLDGYNEISNEKIRGELNRLLNSQIVENNRVIITSRKQGLTTALDGFNTCELEKLDREKRISFIKGKGLNEPEKVLDEIDDYKLESLSIIPIFLEFLCEYYEEHGSLKEVPNTRGKLLERIVKRHLDKQSKIKEAKKLEIGKEDLLEHILPSIAFQSLDKSGTNYFHGINDFQEFIEAEELKSVSNCYQELFKSSKKLLREIELLGIVENSGNHYVFWHQLFQDYFTAVELKRRLESNELTLQEEKGKDSFIFNILEYTKFDQAILLLIGLLEDKELSKKLINEIAKHDLLFAGECIAEYDGDRDEFKDIIDKLFEVRDTLSINILIRIGSDRIVAKLHDLVFIHNKSFSWLVKVNNNNSYNLFRELVICDNIKKKTALASYLDLFNRVHASEFLEILVNEKNIEIQKGIAKSYTLLMPENRHILKKFLTINNVEIRKILSTSMFSIFQQINILGVSKDKVNEDILEVVENLKKDNDSEIRTYATLALLIIKKDEKELLAHLKDENPTMRYHVLGELSLILNKKDLTAILLNMVDDSDYIVRKRAIQLLGDTECERAGEVLIKILKTSSNQNENMWAMNSIAKIQSKPVIDACMDIIKDKYNESGHYITPYVKHFNLEEDKKISTFLTIIKDRNKKIYYRNEACLNLAEIGSAKALNAFESLSKSSERIVREIVAEQLWKFNDPKANKLLLKLLKDSCSNVRICALKSLSDLDGITAYKTIKKYHFKDKIYYRHAIECLYKALKKERADDWAYGELCKILENEDAKFINITNLTIILYIFEHIEPKKILRILPFIEKGIESLLIKQLINNTDESNNYTFTGLVIHMADILIRFNYCEKAIYLICRLKQIMESCNLGYLKEDFHKQISRWIADYINNRKQRNIELDFKYWELCSSQPVFYS